MDARSRLKGWTKGLLSRTGLLRLGHRLVPARVAILRYHSVQDEPDRFEHSIGAGIIHPSRCFARQMELLARRYSPVTLDDVLLFLRGEKRLPRRAVAVTFDDGYRDNLEIAAPIMERLGISGTFYMTVSAIDADRLPWFCRLRHAFGTTDSPRLRLPGDGERVYDLETAPDRRAAFLAASAACGSRSGSEQARMIESIEQTLGAEALDPRPYMLDWDGVRALRARGHIVGSHTLTHPNVARIPEAEAEHELRESKRILEFRLGEPVVHFSYPNPILQPHWTARTGELAERAEYGTAVTSEPGPVSARDWAMSLHRVAVPRETDGLEWALDCALLGRPV